MHRRRLHPQRLIKNTNPLFVIQLRAKSSGTQRRIGKTKSKKQSLVLKSSGKMNASYDQHITIVVASLGSTGGRGGGVCHKTQPEISCDKSHILLQVQCVNASSCDLLAELTGVGGTPALCAERRVLCGAFTMRQDVQAHTHTHTHTRAT